MADRTGEGASAGDLWQGLRIRMDDRQAAYRRGGLRGPIAEPARQPGGKELAFDLDLACELYLQGDPVLRCEIRHSFDEWTAVRGRMLAKAWSFADKLADTCDDSWLRLGLHRRQRYRFQGHLRGARRALHRRFSMRHGTGALLRRSSGDLLRRLEHGAHPDEGLFAPFRRIGVLRGVGRTEAGLSVWVPF